MHVVPKVTLPTSGIIGRNGHSGEEIPGLPKCRFQGHVTHLLVPVLDVYLFVSISVTYQ